MVGLERNDWDHASKCNELTEQVDADSHIELLRSQLDVTVGGRSECLGNSAKEKHVGSGFGTATTPWRETETLTPSREGRAR